jgi:hypothetical protein
LALGPGSLEAQSLLTIAAVVPIAVARSRRSSLSFDHLVGAGEDGRRNRQAERLSRFAYRRLTRCPLKFALAPFSLWPFPERGYSAAPLGRRASSSRICCRSRSRAASQPSLPSSSAFDADRQDHAQHLHPNRAADWVEFSDRPTRHDLCVEHARQGPDRDGLMTLPEYDERIRGYAAELGVEFETFARTSRTRSSTGSTGRTTRALMQRFSTRPVIRPAIRHWSRRLPRCAFRRSRSTSRTRCGGARFRRPRASATAWSPASASPDIIWPCAVSATCWPRSRPPGSVRVSESPVAGANLFRDEE